MSNDAMISIIYTNKTINIISYVYHEEFCSLGFWYSVRFCLQLHAHCYTDDVERDQYHTCDEFWTIFHISRVRVWFQESEGIFKIFVFIYTWVATHRHDQLVIYHRKLLVLRTQPLLLYLSTHLQHDENDRSVVVVTDGAPFVGLDDEKCWFIIY